jgi:hypothetical protein
VEKAQVTFAVTASGLSGPLGRPLSAFFVASNRGVQSLVGLREVGGVLYEAFRYEAEEGPLSHLTADAWTIGVSDEFYHTLLTRVGLALDGELLAP